MTSCKILAKIYKIRRCDNNYRHSKVDFLLCEYKCMHILAIYYNIYWKIFIEDNYFLTKV